MRGYGRASAFTLIELLVVTTILSILIGLLLAAVQRARAAAARAKCQNNLKQLGIALHAYHDANRRFPPVYGPSPFLTGFPVLLLPYLEQNAVYDSFNMTAPVETSTLNYAGRTARIPVFLCPADPSTGRFIDSGGSVPPGVTAIPVCGNNYYGNAGTSGCSTDINTSGVVLKPLANRGFFGVNSEVKFSSVSDGASNTIALAEIRRGAHPSSDQFSVTAPLSPAWGLLSVAATNPNNFSRMPACNNLISPINQTGLRYYRAYSIAVLYTHTMLPNSSDRDCLDPSVASFGSQFHLASRSAHSGGVNVCLADGSVRFIRDTITMENWKAIGTRAGEDSGSFD